MPTDKNEGNRTKKNGKKKLRKKRILRLLLILTALFFVLASITGLATYRVVSAYMAEVPDFDPEKLIPSLTSFLYDKNGDVVTPLMGAENRIVITLDDMSDDLINAFLAIEDERFFDHPGFDVRGIARAAYNNLVKRGSGMQGGSTITQQLVKNAFFTPERTMKRKIQELYLSYQMERIYSKEEILEFYLNRIFFDYNAYGVEAAAKTYFGKSAKDVTLAEAAMLAGIPNLPGRYSPLRNLEESKNRQALILNRMADLGMISAAEARAARSEELNLMPPPKRSYPYPYFVDYVIQDEALALLGSLPEYKDYTKAELFDVLYKGGLHIYTTLDRDKQRFVEETLDNPDLYPFNAREEGKPPQPQTSVVVADPTTGHIVAMVGGREYDEHTNVINRAVRGRMQAGSVLKPILAYTPAFQEGLASPGSVLDDAPGEWKSGSGSYLPHNFDSREFNGLVTVRYSLIRSLNLPAVRLFEQVGVAKGKDYAERMGITSLQNDHGLGMVLGGLERGVSVFEVAQAFSVLANEGVRVDLTTITKITDSRGKVVYEHRPVPQEIVGREAAWLTTSILRDAVTHGTAASLKIGRPAAAKTGTSDRHRDVWMAAYTPDYVTVFWIGRDAWPDNNNGNFSSFRHSVPFMNPIMKFIHEGLPVRDFVRPENLQSVAVCSKSGLRPGPNCPTDSIVSDWFIPRNIPSDICEMHVEREICTESGLLASEYCPEHVREKKIFLDRPEYIITDDRWRIGAGRAPADAALKPPTGVCEMHTTPPPSSPVNPYAFVAADGTVTLSWQAGGAASGYLIFRKGPESDTYTQLTDRPTEQLYYADGILPAGTYSYQIVAVNSQGVKSAPVTASVAVEEWGAVPYPPPSPQTNGSYGNGRRNNGNGNGN